LVSSNDHSITTAAARFGYAIDHWMLYGKVGGGWVANNDFTVTNVTTGVSLTCGHFTITCSESVGGWLVGAGFEYALTNNWTVKLEYDYLGLGNRTFVIPATAPLLAGDTFTSNNRNVQMIKVGFNYLFNWGVPLAARYWSLHSTAILRAPVLAPEPVLFCSRTSLTPPPEHKRCACPEKQKYLSHLVKHNDRSIAIVLAIVGVKQRHV
jgi:Outer membrane protein beta-barrel domain